MLEQYPSTRSESPTIEQALESFKEVVYPYLVNPVSLGVGHLPDDDDLDRRVLVVQLKDIPDREARFGMPKTYKGYTVIYMPIMLKHK